MVGFIYFRTSGSWFTPSPPTTLHIRPSQRPSASRTTFRCSQSDPSRHLTSQVCSHYLLLISVQQYELLCPEVEGEWKGGHPAKFLTTKTHTSHIKASLSKASKIYLFSTSCLSGHVESLSFSQGFVLPGLSIILFLKFELYRFHEIGMDWCLKLFFG